MNSSIQSRKRKRRQSISDQLAGIFTRSKSQIYVHKNRSGHARPDSFRTRQLVHLKKRLRKSDDVVLTCHTSVKDLRTHRVFSPVKITTDDDDDVSSGDDDDDVDLKGESETVVAGLEVLDLKGDVEDDVSNGGEEEIDDESLGDLKSDVADDVIIGDGVDLKGETEVIVDLSVSDSVRENDVVQLTPIESISVVSETVDAKEGSMNKSRYSVTSLRGRKKVYKSPSSFSYRRMLAYLNDVNDDSLNFEIVETKRPQQVHKLSNKASDMFVAVSDDRLNKVQSMNVDVPKSNEDVIDDCVQTTPPDSDIDTTLGACVKPSLKPILNSCSRMKVLQNPTSFSHRRLLPYLMSVAGDNSCALKSNQLLKLEKVTQNQYHNDSMNEYKIDSNFGKPTTTDEKSDSPTSSLIPVDTSFSITKAVTLVSSDNNFVAGGPDTDCSVSTSQTEGNLQAEKAVSDSSIKFEQSSPKNILKSVEEGVSKVIITCTEQSIDTNAGKERPHQSLLPITPVNALGTTGKSIKSGILKRTPRGCRGICNCLNCTSFRLHAERSFEFSRNQMYDAEEVALELISDLSSIRKILEKTASDCSSLGADKEKQVKEACEKALYKEEVAKARLAQMNEDLSIHCRSTKLLRPNVTFANKTEEKVISRDHVYGKDSI